MSKMINGKWFTEGDIATVSTSGEYQRENSVLRNWVGEARFPAAANRYHLYVADNCPWAHRTLLFRTLKQLENVISVSTVQPRRTDQGWVFGEDPNRDDLFGFDYLHQVYHHAVNDYTGRVTVPVFFDRKSDSIVSNESSEIIRMLNNAFDEFTDVKYDFYPDPLREQIDHWNERIYRTVNNGVYRAGFASSQEAYDRAVAELFETLESIETHLAHNEYLVGGQATEADWRLFPTLARFDVAYYGAFKCNLKRLTDFPNLWRYARRLYHYPGVADTVKFDIYKYGYFSPSVKRNPFGIVPKGPIVDWSL